MQLPGDKGRRNYKGHKETFSGNRYIHYCDCGDGFLGTYIRQNLSNHRL